MIIPVRCISCGRVIAQFWEEYKKKMAAKTEEEAKETKTPVESSSTDKSKDEEKKSK